MGGIDDGGWGVADHLIGRIGCMTLMRHALVSLGKRCRKPNRDKGELAPFGKDSGCAFIAEAWKDCREITAAPL
jgi:hypothetical protein